ncbi:MAG TPA: sugar ABC transporter ATP-binding protein [Streptosporangiaceae bacterium]|nr:sugar ABC transporter ATP-binding protein [Streptosporangiaceae bacterium]
MTNEASRHSALSVRDVSKTFGAVQALRSVSFDVQPGTLHALLGGNGSGKSTLIKILAGVEHSEPGGEFLVQGRVVRGDHTTPALSKSAGLHFVHQDPGLFPQLTVADNLALGRGYATGPGQRIKTGQLRDRAVQLLATFNIEASPAQLVAELSASKQTMIAIARALQDADAGSGGILVLDEPTASLPEQDAHLLLHRLRALAESGQSVLYVTHRIDEVVGVADQITVLRDGAHVITRDATGVTEADLIALITGRPVREVFPQMPEPTEAETVLSVSGLCAGPLRDVSLTLRRGEVLGIGGLLGSGRTTLLRVLFGDLTPSAGEIVLNGKPVKFRSPAEAIGRGVGYIPEDRTGESAFPDLTVRDNLLIPSILEYWRRLKMASSRERADARRSIRRFGIKASSEAAPMSSLSGGNQQKVILARWLTRGPALLLLDEPTQGVDVGARTDIYHLVREAVAAGTAILIVASDPEELSRVTDRVLVLRRGRVVAEVNGPDIDASHLTALAFAGETKTS